MIISRDQIAFSYNFIPSDLESEVEKAGWLEFRFDLFDQAFPEIDPDLFLRSNFIATCRSNSGLTDAERISILESAIQIGFQYVDLDVDEDRLVYIKLLPIIHKYSVKIIASYHHWMNFPGLDFLSSKLRLMNEFSPDIYKLAVRVKDPKDAAKLKGLYFQKDLVAFAMGEEGKISRLHSLEWGAPFTYVSPEGGKKTAEGQYSYAELLEMQNQILEDDLNTDDIGEIKVVEPAFKQLDIIANSSKSHFQRVLLAALLCNGTSLIQYKDLSDDVSHVLKLIQKLGAKLELSENEIQILGGLKFSEKEFNVGESGLAARMFLPVLSLASQEGVLKGEGSLLNRTQEGVIDSLAQMGVQLASNGGYLPIRFKGPLRGGRYEVDGSLSSQFLSGLLFALPLLESDSVLKVSSLRSKPYIDLSLQVLTNFGIKVEHDNYIEFKIPANQKYIPVQTKIEGDWSGASYFIIMALLNGSAQIHGLNENSFQADRLILDLFPKSNLWFDNEILKVRKLSQLKPLEVDLKDSPDLFPALVAYAVHANGISRLKGISRLLNKESNRRDTLIEEFGKLGADLWTEGDYMLIKGKALKGGVADSCKDHRIAMALATASVLAQTNITIQNSQSVSKSFPHFWDLAFD